MLIPFFEWLRELGMPGAALMGHVTYRTVMAFIIALAVTLMIGGRIIKYLELKNIGDAPRELGVDGLKRKKGVPTMDGVIIFSAIILPVLLFCKLSNINVLLLVGTTIILTVLGFADDYIKTFKHNKEGLSGKWKIVVQVILGVFYWHDSIFKSCCRNS